MKTLILKINMLVWAVFLSHLVQAETPPEFWPSTSGGVVPLTVEFNDDLGPNPDKEWDFDGDGITDATGDAPQFIYERPGIYTVTLKIGTELFIEKMDLIEAIDPTVPEFWADIRQGPAPLMTTFYSSGIPDVTQMSWDFDGDGVEDATTETAEFYYEEPGEYTVTLSFFDGQTMQKIVKDMYIKVGGGDPMVPDFWVDMNQGVAPMDAYFSDNFFNAISKSWDFDGDGIEDASGDNPMFTYKDPGVYTVILTVDEGNGPIEIRKDQYIHVVDGSVPDFWADMTYGQAPLWINFQTTLPSTTQVSWDFDGDGNIDATDIAPSFYYEFPGEYSVILFYDDNGTTKEIKKEMYIFIEDGNTQMPDFWPDMPQGVAPHTVNFSDNFFNAISKSWDLDGDGIEDATGDNPSFIYEKPGVYTVVLTIDEGDGPYTIEKMDIINVIDGSVPDFWSDITYGQAPLTVNFQSTFPENEQVMWDFDGDGIDDDNTPYPTYTYYDPGQYTVTLKYFDATGNEQKITKDMYIHVENQGSGDELDFWVDNNYGYAPHYAYFQSSIPSDVEYFAWDFDNDGAIDLENEMYPQFEYFTPGIYSVALIYDRNGVRDTLTKEMFITVEDAKGRFCDQPVQAMRGTNMFNSMDGSSMYYEYVAQLDGFIILSTCGMTDMGTWANISYSCHEYGIHYEENNCGDQTRIIIEARKGEKYLIEWNSYTHGGTGEPMPAEFEWTLTEREIQPGELCDKPAEAIEGSNVANFWGASEGIWFRYIAKKDGIVTISNCNNTYEDTELIVFKDSCFGSLIAYSDDDCELQSVTQFQTTIGGTYYIWWQNADRSKQTSFKWDLIFEEGQLPPGTSCDNPVFLKEGENIAELKNSLNWFEYTAQSEGKVYFEFPSGYDPIQNDETGALKDCQVGEGQDQRFLIDEKGYFLWSLKGQTFNIYWFNETGTARVEQIAIFEAPQPLPEGLFCERPIAVKTGVNKIPSVQSMSWYTYTAEKDGNLRIANCGTNSAYSRVSLFNSCNSYPIAQDGGSCNGQAELFHLVKAGEQYLISWQSEYPDQFEWDLNLFPINDASIVEFAFMEQTSPAVINNTDRTVKVQVGANADLGFLTPMIKVPYMAQAFLNGEPYYDYEMRQYNFREPVILDIIAADGVTKSEWKIEVDQATVVSSEAKVYNFSLNMGQFVADIVDRQIILNLPFITNTCFELDIVTSPMSFAETTFGDHLHTGYYYCLNTFETDSIKVTAEDGTVIWWQIIVNMEEAPRGYMCETPLEAMLGINEGDFVGENIWYAFIAPEDGFYGLRNRGNYMNISLFYDDCQSTDPKYDYLDPDDEFRFSAKAGQKVFIQLMGYSQYPGQSSPYAFDLYQTFPSNEAEIEYIEISDYPVVNTKYDYINGVIEFIIPYAAPTGQTGMYLQLSDGAKAMFNSMDIYDYLELDLATENILEVVAEDGTIKKWTVLSTRLEANTESDILTFSMLEQIEQPVINKAEAIVYAQVKEGTDLTQLSASINTSLGSIITVNGLEFFSGETFLDFSVPVEVIVIAEDGSQKIWTIKVSAQSNTTIPITGIFFEEPEYILEVGFSKMVNAFVDPPYATNPLVKYSILDETIASVDPQGMVFAHAVGQTEVTATDESGSFTATAIITVVAPMLRDIEVVPSQISVINGDKFDLQVKFYPEETTEREIIWTVSNPDIIALVENGIFTALAPGRTEIIATSASNEGIFSVSIVEVVETEIPLEMLSTVKERVYLSGDGMYQITPIFFPEDATYKGLIYSSDNPEVASVDEFGTVYANGAIGTATIVITSDVNPNVYTKLDVIVERLADILVEAIKIPETINLSVNKAIILPVDVLPTEATNKAITWISGDRNIVEVYEDGSLVGISEGEAIVFAISKDGSAISSNECLVIVQQVPVEAISVNVLDELVLEIGTIEDQVRAIVQPIEATNKSVIWKSDDEAVAKVDSVSGVIITTGVGTTSITAISVENPTLTASFTVKVLPEQMFVEELKMAISESSDFLGYIETNNLAGNESGNYPVSVIEELSNIRLAAINTLETSTSQIIIDATAAALFDKLVEARNSMIGKVAVEQIVLNSQDIVISIKKVQLQLKAEILPLDATNRKIQWISENEAIASVSAQGVVTLESPGTTVIYAEATDGSTVYDSCIVKVFSPVSEILLPDAIGLEIGESQELEYAILPANASNKTIIWEVENSEILEIDANGVVFAKSLGSTKIIATSFDGAVSAMTIVSVVEKVTAVSAIELPEKMTVALGDLVAVKPIIKPFNATDKTIFWSTSSPVVASVTSLGLVEALAPGTVKIFAVTNDGGFIDSTMITVLASLPPVIADIPTKSIKLGTDSITVRLPRWISDDNTSFENLQIDITASVSFDVRIEDEILIIKQTSETKVGEETIEVTVTDRDGLTSTQMVTVIVSDIANTPPVIAEITPRAIKSGSEFNPIALEKFVTDDYTAPENILWDVIQGSDMYAFISDNYAQVIILNPAFIGTDTVRFIATDEEGLSDTIAVSFTISEKTNLAPIVSEIPDQVQTNETAFTELDLSMYVEDDYTIPADIVWEASLSGKVAVTIDGSIATVIVIDNTWIGSAEVIFTATDEGGLSITIPVTYTQKASIDNSNWLGKPQADFYADRTVVAVGYEANFHASISGVATSWAWIFEDGSPAESNELDQKVSYNVPGTYDVTFIAANDDGIDTAFVADYISVFGILETTDTVCSGGTVNISVSDETLTSYTWSNGETTPNISPVVTETETFVLTATSGLFKLIDSITIFVPEVLDLGVDTAICANEELVYDFAMYESVDWNMEGMQSDVKEFVASEVGKYMVSVTDSLGCTTTDSVSITEIYAIPVVDLGDDTEICLGTDITLTATEIAENTSVWSTGDETNSITVSETGMYIVTVTNANLCSNVDSVSILVLQPYAEQIGMVTTNELGDKVIVGWERTKGQGTKLYKVLRETGVTDEYDTLGSVAFNDPSFFIDATANTTQQAYKYKLVTVDSCGNMAESMTHKTMHLQMSQSVEAGINLTWTPYEPDTLFRSYVIYRETPNGTLDSVASVARGTGTSWTEVDKVSHAARYRVAVRFDNIVDPSRLKSDSGPYSQSISNLSEAIVASAIDETATLNITIFPVPVSETMSITIDESIISEVSVVLYNSLGVPVLEQTSTIADNSIEVDVQSLPGGAYTLIVNTNGEVAIQTIIIE